MNSTTSNYVKVDDLKADQPAEENIFFNKDYILIEKGMMLEKTDVELLKKWKIEKIYAKNYLQSEKKFTLYFREQIKEFRTFTNGFLNELKEFYEMIRLNYKISMPDYDSQFQTLLTFYKNPSNFYSFYINTEVGSNEYEQIALRTAFYSIMLGIRMDLTEEELKSLFYASIFADIGFQHKSEKNVLDRSHKKNISRDSFKVTDHHYLDFHVKLSCDILRKELKASKELVYLVLMQHVHLDGTGFPNIKGKSVNKLARVFSVAHSFVYFISDFLEPFRKTPMMSHAIILMLRHKERYDEQVLKSLLSTNSFFPPGEVLLLSNQKMAVSIKATYRNPKCPIVETIVKPKKIGLSKTETVNLDKENLDIVAIIGKQTVRQKVIRNIYKKL